MLTYLSACSPFPEDNSSHFSQASSLPETLSVVQHVEPTGNSCSSQGIEIVYGLDHNRDGKLSPYERSTRSLVCGPDTGLNGPAVASMPAKPARSDLRNGS